MSETGRRARRRALSAEERALWKTVIRTVAPLRPAKSPAVDAPAPQPVPAPPPDPLPPSLRSAVAAARQAKLAKASKPVRLAPPPQTPQPTPPAPPPPLAPLERRTKLRVARGREPIDARIDLHGLTQDEAHAALIRFVRHAQTRGARMVLVITGKGGPPRGFAENDAFLGERGVLRRLVPLWLGMPEFRRAIVGFEPAHASHGGEGAIYVRIRKARA